ncbi:2-C-methyl-D-erythritol 2,4-cyclodiphosphate synthase [bacterium]|nr:2-C-methyl-D-erythritol 2,4-cyclodiphosphate synthase [bacterium]
MRVGIGYDVHRLVENRKLILGGVEIPFCKGLLGHSDADVLCHAIMDALLGAAALGDIGKLFPDNDSGFKDANSLNLLNIVQNKLRDSGFSIVNIDSVIIAQKPKISSYVNSIKENLALALNCNVNQISVKATTTEKLGYIGREEGIAAQAVALIESSI